MKKNKCALITGITGQDGAYLARLLVSKGYEVHGIIRRSSSPNTARLDSLIDHNQITLHYGDLTDAHSLFQVIEKITPDEIYNLGAQSHVGVSFETPEFTANVNALGTIRILESIRLLGLEKSVRFYQASTSELFGKVQETPQKESTPFYPRSPYAASKLYAYWMTINYRESYGLFACNGILFNHESPLRGEEFVTRKITRSLGRIAKGLEKEIFLGNLDAMRDWGHAEDFVEMQWRILQQENPDDYVIATGKQHSVRTCVNVAASAIGIKLEWQGSGLQEQAIVCSVDPIFDHQLAVGQTIVRICPKYFRPAEVDTLLGDPSKAFSTLNFSPRFTFEEMICEMALADLKLAQSEVRENATLS